MVGVSNSLEWIDGETDAAGSSLIPARDFPDFKQLLFCSPRPSPSLLPWAEGAYRGAVKETRRSERVWLLIGG